MFPSVQISETPAVYDVKNRLTADTLAEWSGDRLHELDSPSGDPENIVAVFDTDLMKLRFFACESYCEAISIESSAKSFPGVVAAAVLSDIDPASTRAAQTAVNPGAVTVTRGTPSDIEFMLRIERIQWSSWALNQPFYRQLMEVAPSAIHVARDGRGDVVGFAVGLVCEGGQQGWVLGIDVAQTARGFGVGSKLLGEALQSLEARGCKYATAIIDPMNVSSITLFERAGFKATEVLPGYFEPHKSQIRFQRAL